MRHGVAIIRVDMRMKEKSTMLIYKGAITQRHVQCLHKFHLMLTGTLLGLEQHPIISGNSHPNIWYRRPLFDSLDPFSIPPASFEIEGNQIK